MASSDIAGIPTEGKRYKIIKDDFLSSIAKIAYGDGSKWPIIYQANQTTLKSLNDPDLIFPGEIIIIPRLSDRITEGKKLTGKGPNELTIVINDIEVPYRSLEIIRTMDTASDGWTANIAWNPGEDSELDEATVPYGYQDASVYIGNNILVDGRLYNVKPSGTVGGREKVLSGFSFTKDAVDSTIKPPYEVNNVDLRRRSIDLIKPLGINVVWEIDGDNFKFTKITASETDKIISHLMKYVKQKGGLISSDESGNLVFLKANVDGESVGTIEEGQQGFLKYEASFDGTKRFNSTKVIGQTPGGNAKYKIAKDDGVPVSRMQTINMKDISEGELKTAADWNRSKSVAEALTIPFISNSYYSPNGERWTENTIVTVKSEVISIANGFDFLIKRVKFSKNNNGRTTELSLVPPQVFSGEPIPDIFK